MKIQNQTSPQNDFLCKKKREKNSNGNSGYYLI